MLDNCIFVTWFQLRLAANFSFLIWSPSNAMFSWALSCWGDLQIISFSSHNLHSPRTDLFVRLLELHTSGFNFTNARMSARLPNLILPGPLLHSSRAGLLILASIFCSLLLVGPSQQRHVSGRVGTLNVAVGGSLWHLWNLTVPEWIFGNLVLGDFSGLRQNWKRMSWLGLFAYFFSAGAEQIELWLSDRLAVKLLLFIHLTPFVTSQFSSKPLDPSVKKKPRVPPYVKLIG